METKSDSVAKIRLTPIGQGWTNARGLRGLEGTKPDPKKIFCVHFNISSVRSSILLYG